MEWIHMDITYVVNIAKYSKLEYDVLKIIVLVSVVSFQLCMIFKFFELQVTNPTQGDWASACFKDLKDLRITESLEEIKQMSKMKFNKMVKERINENALNYLTQKQQRKGKEIIYKRIELADYFQPCNESLLCILSRVVLASRPFWETPTNDHFSILSDQVSGLPESRDQLVKSLWKADGKLAPF